MLRDNLLAMAGLSSHFRCTDLELADMAQHRIKYLLAAGGLAAAITAGASSDAYAFTETTVPPSRPQTAQPVPSAPLDLQKPDSQDSLALVKPGDSQPNGTELRIPGIGSLGTLPKLDFGLGQRPAAEPRSLDRPEGKRGPGRNHQGYDPPSLLRHAFSGFRDIPRNHPVQ